MGGKNSVFKKPLGTGKGSVNKAIDKTPLKVVKDTVNKVNDNVGIKKVGSVYDANKQGINAVAGVAARGAASYFTFGASEALGMGGAISKQFGGDNNIAQYGGTVGTLSGIAGAGSTAIGRGILTKASTLAGGVASSVGSSVVASKLISGGGSTSTPVYMPQGGQVGLLDNLGNSLETGFNQWANNQVSGLFNPQGSTTTKNTAPLTALNSNSQIVGVQSSKMIMYVIGGVLAIVLLMFAFRKK